MGIDRLAGSGMRQGSMTVDYAELRTELAADMGRAGFMHGEFVLGGGVDHPTYFDKYAVLTRPGMLARCARVFAPALPSGIDRLAATSVATAALATAVALQSGHDLLLPKEAVDADQRYAFGGEFFPDVRVCLLEDVIFSGSRAIAAATSLTDAGASVVKVIALLDREQGGIHRLEGAGFSASAIFLERNLSS